jgi:hypothetical protein
MFAKTLLSVMAVGITIVGLLMIFNAQGYFVFFFGMVMYFLLAISGGIGSKISNLEK